MWVIPASIGCGAIVSPALLKTTSATPAAAAGPIRWFARSALKQKSPLDYSTQPLARHDRFLLCSDGVHGFLPPEAIAEVLRERSASEEPARAIVAAALKSGSTDNCTALVVDVVELPTAK